MPGGPVMFKILIAGTLILGLLVLWSGLAPRRRRQRQRATARPPERSRGQVVPLDRRRRAG